MAGCSSGTNPDNLNDSDAAVVQSTQANLTADIVDKFWLLTEMISSDDSVAFQFNPDDFFRYNVRFRSDTVYVLSTHCDARNGFYSIDGSTTIVTQPTLTGAVFDCVFPSDVTSFNDTQNRGVFPDIIEFFNSESLTTILEGDQLTLRTIDGRLLRLRECIYDCFVPI